MSQDYQFSCPGCGEVVDIRALKEGDRFECARCAGLTLELVCHAGTLALQQVHSVSCPGCDKNLEVPTETQPGDMMSCCGQTFRLTYEFGAYALE